jgi:hypothetical protein
LALPAKPAYLPLVFTLVPLLFALAAADASRFSVWLLFFWTNKKYLLFSDIAWSVRPSEDA